MMVSPEDKEKHNMDYKDWEGIDVLDIMSLIERANETIEALHAEEGRHYGAVVYCEMGALELYEGKFTRARQLTDSLRGSWTEETVRNLLEATGKYYEYDEKFILRNKEKGCGLDVYIVKGHI